MAKGKETPTRGAWHRDPAVEKTCPIGSCCRDGGEFRASQRLATGTRGSGQSHGSCARNGLQCQPGAELGAVEMQGRKAPRGRDTKKARDAPQHGLEARSNGRSRDRNRCTGTGWAPSAKSQQRSRPLARQTCTEWRATMEHHEPCCAGSRAGMVGAAIETVVRAHDEHRAASRRPARGVTARGRKRSQQSRRPAAPEHGPRQREASEKRRRARERSARARGALAREFYLKNPTPPGAAQAT